ncbi:hypothetical protein C5167_044508 [Papaver somniferum]|uniref:Uncharacterized protein n=1 Tax=Papaver somniferum TaxID=3469 RepID=A0A4Y7LCM9_PAPSO|nr:hypothetical protein C5167_044508 [Papaver somniferum]
MRHGGGMSTSKADLESDSTVVCSFLGKRVKEAFERGSMRSSIRCLSRLVVFEVTDLDKGSLDTLELTP